MKKSLDTLYYFLSLFDFKPQDYFSINDLFKKELEVNILDSNNRTIGKALINKNGRITFKVMLENLYITAIGKYDETKMNYNFKYMVETIDDKDKIHGNINMINNAVKNDMIIFKDGEFVSKCGFNSSYHTFYICNKARRETINYMNNSLIHINRNKKFEVNYDSGFMSYGLSSPKEESLSGGYNVYFPFAYSELSAYIEAQFNMLVKEFDPRYFGCVEDEKELVNSFVPNLFENTAKNTFKNFDDKKLDCIFNIKDDEKQNVLLKKK